MKTLFTTAVRATLCVVFLSFSFSVLSQEYGVIPDDVRAKMDENKIIGVHVYSGIATSYTFTTEGLSLDEHSILSARAQELSEVRRIEFRENGVVMVECAGGTAVDPVKKLFSELVSNISAIQIENYIIQNN